VLFKFSTEEAAKERTWASNSCEVHGGSKTRRGLGTICSNPYLIVFVGDRDALRETKLIPCSVEAGYDVIRPDNFVSRGLAGNEGLEWREKLATALDDFCKGLVSAKE
jgi:hypothetical protein